MTGSNRAGKTINAVAVTGGHLWLPNRATDEVGSEIASAVVASANQDWTRRLDPFSVQAVLAVTAARFSAGLIESVEHSKSIREGVCVGTAFGAQHARVRFASRMVSHGLASSNPIDFPDSIDGAPAAHVARNWGLQGPSLTFVEGTSSAVSALVAAARQLVFGTADRMHVVVGDVFDTLLRRAMCETLPTSLAINESRRSESLSKPVDAVLALVLERHELRQSEPGTSLVGFLNALDNGPESTLNNGITEVTAHEIDSDLYDLSGVLDVAGAWLGVADPMGNRSVACQDEAMPRSWRRCRLPNSHLPALAFLGPSK